MCIWQHCYDTQRHKDVTSAREEESLCDMYCIALTIASQQETQVSSLKHPDPYTRNAEDR